MLEESALRRQRWRLEAIDTLIEEVLQIDASIHGIRRLESHWSRGRAEQFAAAITQIATSDKQPSYLPGLVIPRMYTSRVERPSDPETTRPITPNSEAVLRALMLAHGIELDDLLSDAARYSARDDRPEVLLRALTSFVTLRPLAQLGIVSYANRPPGVYKMKAASVFFDHADTPEFRRSMLEVAGHIAPEKHLEPLRGPAAADPDDFLRWLEHAFATTLLAEHLDDLVSIEDAQDWSNASVWLPSRNHLALLGVVASAGWPAPAGLIDAAVGARLVELALPVYESDISAVVDLRRNSDVLDSWRRALAEAIMDLDHLPPGTGWDTERAEIQRAMEARAAQFAAQAKREFRRSGSLTRPTTMISFSLIGGLAGAAVSGSILVGLLSSAASSGSRAAAEALMNLSAGRSKRAALGAARDHALIIANR